MSDYFGSGSYIAAPWVGVIPRGMPGTKVSPLEDYVGTGPGWMAPNLLRGLEQEFDEVTRFFGVDTYRAMLTDPAVNSSYRSLQLAVVQGGISLMPSHDLPVWHQRDTLPENPDQKLSPAQSRSDEVLAFSERLVARVKNQIPTVNLEWADCLGFGMKLMEFTFKKPEPEEEDSGKLVWSHIRSKPNNHFRFVVDQFMIVRRILCWNVKTQQYNLIDYEQPEARAKFTWWTWMPEDNDPRGTSILRAAYNAWNLKIQTWPMYYQFLVRFGSPGLDGTLAEGDQTAKPDIDDDGNEVVNTLVSPSQHFMRLLRLYRGGGIIVHPAGSTVEVREPQSSGEAMLSAFDLFDRQITQAIEMQVQAKMQAQNGTKSGSEEAANTKGLVPGYARDELAACWRKAIKHAIELNFSKADAEMYCPDVAMGSTEKQDRSKEWTGAASLGYQVGQSQLQKMDTLLGLPVRNPAEDQKVKDDAMQKQQDLVMANNKSLGGPDGPSSKEPGAKPLGDQPKAPTGKPNVVPKTTKQAEGTQK